LKDNNKIIIYNVAYCPKYNPIEYVFNTSKSEIRNSYIDTCEQLKIFIESYVKKMNKIGFKNFFQKSFNNLYNK
jgi:transposase